MSKNEPCATWEDHEWEKQPDGYNRCTKCPFEKTDAELAYVAISAGKGEKKPGVFFDMGENLPVDAAKDPDGCVGHDSWTGLHGPVTYVGNVLYTDNPNVMLLYWAAWCKGDTVGIFDELFPELVIHRAFELRGQHEQFVFVHIDGVLKGWAPISMLTPSMEELRGIHGKALGLHWADKVRN